MQGKEKWHPEEKEYGHKRRKKKVLSLFESKGKPDPYRFYFAAMIFLVIGIVANLHFLHLNEELRLKNPNTINVKLVESNCYGQSSSGKHVQGPHMFNTYVYSPKQDNGREETYKISDSVSYASESKCKVDLENATSLLLRSHVWYEPASPWKARWTLDERSPNPLLWFTSALSLLLFVFGFLSHRKKYRDNDVHSI